MADAAAVQIFTGQDFYVPYFEVKIAGRPQSQAVVRDILSVTYKDNITEIDSFELNINNWDAGKRTFKYSDDDLFDPGKEVELWMGYYGTSLRLMIRGQITGLHPSFPSGGGSALAVSGLNLLHKLRIEQQPKTYENVTDTDVARQIAQRLGIELEANPAPNEKRYQFLIQDSKYDIVFLMERARRIGYELYVKERSDENGRSLPPVLVFGRSNDVKRPTYDLQYNRTLIDFKPDLTTANQVNEVVVRGWDAVHKKRIEGKATRKQAGIKGVGTAGNQEAIEESFKQRREIIATKPVESEDEANTLALRTLEENAKEMVKATGSTVGLPDLRAGSMVKIGGAGKRFSGRYFVTATTHTIGDSGYTTQFECRREEV